MSKRLLEATVAPDNKKSRLQTIVTAAEEKLATATQHAQKAEEKLTNSMQNVLNAQRECIESSRQTNIAEMIVELARECAAHDKHTITAAIMDDIAHELASKKRFDPGLLPYVVDHFDVSYGAYKKGSINTPNSQNFHTLIAIRLWLLHLQGLVEPLGVFDRACGGPIGPHTIFNATPSNRAKALQYTLDYLKSARDKYLRTRVLVFLVNALYMLFPSNHGQKMFSTQYCKLVAVLDATRDLPMTEKTFQSIAKFVESVRQAEDLVMQFKSITDGLEESMSHIE